MESAELIVSQNTRIFRLRVSVYVLTNSTLMCRVSVYAMTNPTLIVSCVGVCLDKSNTNVSCVGVCLDKSNTNVSCRLLTYELTAEPVSLASMETASIAIWKRDGKFISYVLC